MKGFDTLHVKSAVKSRNKFDLSFSHLTTMNFGEIVPLFCTECVPGDKFNVSGKFFSRMAPLVKPTYGKFQFKTLVGFVPFYQLADDAEAYLAGKATWESETPDLRYITYGGLVSFLNDNALSITQSVPSGGSATNGNIYDSSGTRVGSYDFTYINNSGTQFYKKWNAKGKLYYKILCSLGYTYPQLPDLQSTSTWFSLFYSTPISAMPLLAYAKLYNDWMSQSQRYNTSALTAFLKAVKHNKSVTGYSNSTHIIASTGISTILSNIVLCYENDYFVSAWQTSASPLNNIDNVSSVSVPGYTLGNIAMNNTTGPVASNLNVSQRVLDFLRSYDDWVRRNNYSGSRPVQAVYARFGIKTEDYRSNYAHVITTSQTPLQVGDVTSQSDTTGASLGDYAGKGIMSDGMRFNYEASDYGYLFVFGWYSVTPMNSFGFDRMVLRTAPLDFYNPEFDGLGAEAISFGEMFTSPTPDATDTNTDAAVFGFTERYNSYRFGRDKITGEFRNLRPLDSNSMSVWHSGRNLTAVRAASNMFAQSASMNQMAQNDEEFNRIFAGVTSSEVDHFYMTAQFNVSAVRPMLSLNQVPDLGEGNTTLSRNGNEIS